MFRTIGILTSGGDAPGLNAAIRGVCRAGQERYGMEFVGFREGFRGLVLNHAVEMEPRMLSGILAQGGTVLGTSRDKPHRMPIGGETRDMTDAALETCRRHHLDALVCLGGGGTQKIALRLKKAGLPVITLPKTIDNDVARTDVCFGFDTALGVATEAIDRLHSTAMSHSRIIVVEIMGHRAGWLALGAGLSGGADVILIPEIPYHLDRVAEAMLERKRRGKHFSILAVAEGALSEQQALEVRQIEKEKASAATKKEKKDAVLRLAAFYEQHVNHTLELVRALESRTGMESRLTILGHLQRGGSPSAADRLLATRLGTACASLLSREVHGVMVAARGDGVEAVPLEEVAGETRVVPPDHPWIQAARDIGSCLGD